MTNNRRILKCFAAAAILVAGMTAAAKQETFFATQDNNGIGQTPEGAWNIKIVFDQPGLPPCAPAGTIITATGPGRGTVIAESCYATEGAGYGSWIRTGQNQFVITFIGNSFGTDGTVASTYKVRASASLGRGADSVAGSFKTEFFDLAGTPLGTVSGKLSGVRIAAEP